ncbi:MAG: IS1634 family transposase [Prevotella sp.]
MYIKVQTRIKADANGKKRYFSYPRLYESYRDSNGRIRQRYLIPLNLDDMPSFKDRNAMCGILNDMVGNGLAINFEDTAAHHKAVEIYHQLAAKGLLGQVRKTEEENRRLQDSALVESTVKNVRPRQVGGEHICLETLKRLKLHDFLASKQWKKDQIDLALIQIAARALFPCSENKTVKCLRENSSLCEFFGKDPGKITKDKLYKSALDLYSIHRDIEDYLHKRVCNMFSLKDTVYLFDLTNGYMESTKLTELRQYGRSKEKRSDCPIVVLGAVVNTDGFLVRTQIFPGNTADCKSMQDIMTDLDNSLQGEHDKVVVMDAGISTSDNLKWLREHGYDYITVRRGGSTDDYKITGTDVVTVEDTRKQPIQIQFAQIEGESDTLLLVDSHAKTLKEKSMYDKATSRFEDGLKAILKGITTKGGTKTRDRVNERLGRLKERFSSVQNDYEIKFTYDDKGTATDMTWKKKDGKEQFRASCEGKYLVQTSLKGHSEKQIWDYYNIIRRVEAVFECLKSDLDMRPVYHQNDEAVKAHFHLAILAYWVVSTAQYQLRQQGVSHTWREIRRISSTQVVVSTTATRCDGNKTEIRQCTEPEEQLMELYRLLKIKHPPLKRTVKICVVHFDESKKIDT